MKGAISLAAALAIPLTVQSGSSFPGRDQILFLTFCVILVTLVVQGMSLPLIIRRLGLADAEGEEEREETEARLRAAKRRSHGSMNSRTRVGGGMTRPPGCAIFTSTVAGASPPAIASKPRATRNAPWHTSVSGGSCWTPSVQRSSGSGAKDASATR